ncbi:MAG: lytic transglycosylase domain-containing protein [Acetobacteraceae bacterium]|nr:lytic transglycosylase domain-containing protein [Acetobacteraceae bacterium]
MQWGSRALVVLACVAMLSACAAQHGARSHFEVRGNYRAPGPPEDPWGPFVREAATRHQIPEQWIRGVMQQESGGQQYLDGQLTTSSAGAMGLMQVMPETYEMLRERYGLGNDPYDPHDNIMAGAAYIREMYDRYGSPGFLAAYNAGPHRLEDYLATGAPLPDETTLYVAAVAPRLGGSTPTGGPLPAYAAGQPKPPPEPEPTQPAVVTAEVLPALEDPVPTASALGRTPPPARQEAAPPTIAVDPSPVQLPRREPNPPPRREPNYRFVVGAAYADELPRGSKPIGGGRTWTIQVGAYETPGLAREAAAAAQRSAVLVSAETKIGVAQRPNGGVLFRARLTGLSAEGAQQACNRIKRTGMPCMIVGQEGI